MFTVRKQQKKTLKEIIKLNLMKYKIHTFQPKKKLTSILFVNSLYTVKS